MSDAEVTGVGTVKWRCEPVSRTTHKLFVRIPAKSKTLNADLKLEIVLKDQLFARRTRTADEADPLYSSDEPAYQYRVDTRKHRKRVLAPTTASDKGFTFRDHVTVSIQLLVLRGVRVFPKFYNPLDQSITTFDPLSQTFGDLTITLSIHVLQDRRQMPDEGIPIDKGSLFPLIEVDNDDVSKNPLVQGLHRFVAQYIPNGVRITWLATQQTLEIALANPLDGNSGFAVSFNPEPGLPRPGPLGFVAYDDLVHIRYAGAVRLALGPIKNPDYKKLPVKHAEFYRENFVDPVAWAENGYPTEFTKRFGRDRVFQPNLKVHRPLDEALFFRVQQVGSVRGLPAPHAVFAVPPGDDEARTNWRSYYTDPAVPAFLKLALDVGIGFIPIVGDFVDFVEFNHMLATGRDRWGNKVDNTDLVLAGIAVIPVLGISAGVARALR